MKNEAIFLTLFVFSAFIFSSLHPTTAAARVILYVDQNNANCSDSGSGSQAQPFCHIQPGATQATAGTTVDVASGTYSENVTPAHSGTSAAPIVFTAGSEGTVTVSGQTHGFTVSSKSWITLHGFTVTSTSGDGIYVSGSNNITVMNNTVNTAGHPVSGQIARGIRLNNTNDSTVTGNTVHDNTDAGIYVTGSSTRNTISSNVAHNNARQYTRAAPGIDIRSPGNTIMNNVTHDNEDSGIQIYPGADNSLVVNNVTYNNGDHGIDNLNVTGGRIIGNTVYHNCTSGINVEGTSSNYLVENNIAVDNAVYPAYKGIACSRRRGNVGIYDSAPSGTRANYNLVWLTTSGILYHWGGTHYTHLSDLQAATSQERNGLQADPKWLSPSTWDLHLSAGSPAIDSADSGASGQQSSDVEGNARFDDPATPDTGAGPRTYDDRGAYEYHF